MKNRRSIRTNFITAVVVATVLLVCALAVVMFNFLHSSTDAILLETIPPLTSTAAHSVGVNVGILADRILAVKDHPVFTDPDATYTQKQQVFDNTPYFGWLGLYSSTGYLITGTPYSPPAIQQHMLAELRERLTIIVDVVPGGHGEPEIAIADPIIRHGEVVYYLVGSYSYYVLDYIINNFSISLGSITYIINHQGRYMAHTDMDLVMAGETIFSSFYRRSFVAKLGGIMEKTHRGESGIVPFGRGGTRRILSFAPVEGTHWSVVVETSGNDFVDMIYQGILLNMKFAFILMVLLVVAANMFFVRLVTKPLRAITSHVHQLGEGTFKYYLPRNLCKHDNEIAQLANAFNSMSNSLEVVIRDIDTIVSATGAGRLDARVDVSPLKGDFKKIATGINDSLDLICSYLHAIPEAMRTYEICLIAAKNNKAGDDLEDIPVQFRDEQMREALC